METQVSHLTRTFSSTLPNPLVLHADDAWRPFGREHVGKPDQQISLEHLAFSARRPAELSPDQGYEWLVRHTGSFKPSFVRRTRRAAAAEEAEDEWWLIPPAKGRADAEGPPTPFRLAHGDRIFVVGTLPAGEPVLGRPLSREPAGLNYELLFELSPPPPAAAPAEEAHAHAGAAPAAESPQEMEVDANAPLEARLAALFAELDFSDRRDEAGLRIEERGLRALDRACDLARELEGRTVELRAAEEAQRAALLGAQEALFLAGRALCSAEAELFLDAAPILAAKQRRLAELESEQDWGGGQ